MARRRPTNVRPYLQAGRAGRLVRRQHRVQTAIGRASSTIENVRWFEVTEARGHVENGKVTHLPVTVKVGFTLRP
jgi:flavin-binding protein dodecin